MTVHDDVGAIGVGERRARARDPPEAAARFDPHPIGIADHIDKD